MAIASLYPTIKPSLLLDFANSKKLDPRVTFTRSTTAVYYDGVTTAKAEENLLLRSQDFSATWTLANLTAGSAVTAPDGTATGSSFTASAANGTLTQSVTAIAAEYTFSVYLRRVTGTGDIDITAHSGGTWVTQTITSSWARYTVTQTLTAGSRTPGIRIVTSGDQIEVWGAQLEQRSAATAYTPTTTQPITNYIPQLLTAPAGVPRFDHNPTTGESLGLLVEEQRTNLFTYSEDFSDASWVKVNASIESNVAVSPNGTLSADQLVTTVNNEEQLVYKDIFLTGSPTNSRTPTISFYIKSNGFSGVFIAAELSGTLANRNWVFNLSTGVVARSPAPGGGWGLLAPQITSVGNGWYRCSISFANNNNGTYTIRVGICDPTYNSDVVPTITGNGFSGVFIWGGSLEPNAAFPTSYIPTTSASVTRTADAASMTGVNFSSWYRADEGTLFVESFPRALVSSSGNLATFVSISDATVGNRLRFITSTIGGAWEGATAGVAQFALGSVSVANASYKLAGAYQTNNFAVSINGAAVLTDTSGTIPVVSQMQIGDLLTSRELTGTIKKLAYYPARLTNAQLQALTA